ncbi:MAG: histidine kinase [Lachnospiraceae bacterium]|nr:histidine kinase [Lachnospiraceae bacterium]
MRIVYILDYVFSYGISVAALYYVEALAIDEYNRMGVKYRPKNYVKNIIIVWGIVTAIIYAVSLFIPSIYHLEEGQAVFSIPAYVGLHIMVMFGYICTLIYIVRHRDVIGKYEAGVCFVFIIMASIFAVIDELFELCIGHFMIAIFVFSLYVSIDLHKGLLLERQEKEIALWKTQIMLSQMQPHFLYNVLTTISGMCEMENATEARDVVNHFADYFRTNLDSLDKEKTIPFEKELEHVKTYLWLEKVRFEDSLNICYEIETIDFSVPSLTVQPIVENAVKHGILPKDDTGTVIIRTYETSLDYVVAIEDDGVGFDVNEKQDDTRTHIGIDNVTKRLELICNGTCDIKSDKGKGTVVTIHIPKGDRL